MGINSFKISYPITHKILFFVAKIIFYDYKLSNIHNAKELIDGQNDARTTPISV